MPALLTLLLGALLVGLGVWQLHRLAWKEGLIARIESRTRVAPQLLPAGPTWSALRPEDYDYRHVAIEGRFRRDGAALVFHGAAEGPGYLVLAPFDLTDGGTVVVNRGFVPDGLQDPTASASAQPDGLVRLTGIMRHSEARNLFTPADEPAKNLFFTRDPQPIAAHLGVKNVAPFIVDVDAGPVRGSWPRGGTTELNLPNNHLSYALTWFGLAGALLGVFASFAWRRISSERESAPVSGQHASAPARR